MNTAPGKLSKKVFGSGILIAVIFAAALGFQWAFAAPVNSPLKPQISPMHPTFALLDAQGANVLESGQPLSTLQTCGQCHDSEYIVAHSYHVDLGLTDSAQYPAHAWDSSTGFFGKWDPLFYRYLSQPGDERFDMGTPEWLMTHGAYIVGSGPAATSRTGQPLTSLRPETNNPETSYRDENNNINTWDWQQSGTLEMDCFLCHLPEPNITARTMTIQAGDFRSANTATLSGTGLVEQTGDSWQWNHDAFNEAGELKPEFVTIQDPKNNNCAQCHGMAHTSQQPLVIQDVFWQTASTGQVVSSQIISKSGINLADKENATRTWDVHAERQLKCVDCHFSLNNPAHAMEDKNTKPEHLLYDPRRLEIGEYLQRPNHNFARGQSAAGTIAAELKDSMRRCESCHDPAVGHSHWLPSYEQHMNAIACETCHIPQLYAPAIQSNDWTVINLNSQAQVSYRGIELSENSHESAIPGTVTNLITGYQPVILQRENLDGETVLAPYNLVTSFYWIYDDANGNTRPVRLLDLETAWLENGRYAPEIMSAFDADDNNVLDNNELVLDTTEKQALITERLSALGLNNVRIIGEVQPHSINHSVTREAFAIKDCTVCHSDNSRITQNIALTGKAPLGITPEFVTDSNVLLTGDIVADEAGALRYVPVPANDGIYLFGNSRNNLIDTFGILLVTGTLLGIAGHGALRYYFARKRPHTHITTKRVYMYEAYERFWHWLQAVAIVTLLATGLIIHRPDLFGFISFRHMITMHNVMAVILAVNAALSVFWHLVTGEIQQYIPRPRGFIDDAIVQAKFYISGIFKGEAHPFEKVKEKKLNPLQKATYFGLLVVLLPLQGLTGILMWGVQRWPAFSDLIGGLNTLAPIHTLLAWLFGAFIIGHIYLTTTGVTVSESIRAMVTGWEELETHTEESHE